MLRFLLIFLLGEALVFTLSAELSQSTRDGERGGPRRLHHRPRGNYTLPRGEIDGLVAIYESLGGDGWNSNMNWLNGEDPCTWQFVQCANGHVINIDLSNNNLVGTIPPEIGAFSNLYHLLLSYNAVSSTIPPELSTLGELRSLRLSYNSLTGTLPPHLSALSRLAYFGANNNYLTGKDCYEMPSSPTCLILNRTLSCTGHVPPAYSSLAGLRQLRLEHNDFEVRNNASVPCSCISLGSCPCRVHYHRH